MHRQRTDGGNSGETSCPPRARGASFRAAQLRQPPMSHMTHSHQPIIKIEKTNPKLTWAIPPTSSGRTLRHPRPSHHFDYAKRTQSELGQFPTSQLLLLLPPFHGHARRFAILTMPASVIRYWCKRRGRGGIGRRARFRFLYPKGVEVQLLSAAFPGDIPARLSFAGALLTIRT